MVLNGNDNGNGIVKNTKDFLGQQKVKYFIAGMVTAYALKKISETQFARNAAVEITAGALQLKDSIEEGIENIKEDAEDIQAEAQAKKQIEIFGEDNIDEKIEIEFEDKNKDKNKDMTKTKTKTKTTNKQL